MIKTGSSGGGGCKQFLCELSFYNCWLLIQAITTKTSFMLLALLQIICFTVEVKVKLATKQSLVHLFHSNEVHLLHLFNFYL